MFLNALESSLNEIYVFDPRTLRFSYVNSGARQNLAYSVDAMRSLTPLDILPEFDKARFQELMAPLFNRSQLKLVVETVHKRSDGSTYPVEAHVQLIEASGTEVCLAVVLDITDRKRVLQDLSRRTRQLEILSKTSRTVNTVLEVPVVLRTLVASAMELVDAHSGCAGVIEDGRMVFTEYNQDGHISPFCYVYESGRGAPGRVMETRRPFVSNDCAHDPHVSAGIRGLLNLYNMAIVPILSRAGALLGCITVHNTRTHRALDANDVEMLEALAAAAAVALENAHLLIERRSAEDALRRQTEVLQMIFDHIPVMLSFSDANGRIRLINKEWEKVLGWSAADLKTVDILSECYPDPAVRQEALDFIRAASGKWRQFSTRVRDGRTIDTLWANIRMSDSSMVGIGQDITQRRQLEEQFRQAQKMEAVGRLAGGMAHDFNNLLTVISGYGQMLAMDLPPGDACQSYAEEILRASERASRLTSQLLAFSRRQMAQRKVLDLNAIVRGMTPMLRRLIGEDVALATAFDPDLAPARIDPGQIEQIIANLAINARDAMPEGGKLMVETANTNLHGKPVVMLAVSDTGSGMSPEVKSHLFEPFFTTKEVGKGTGLGLSTVYGIVKQNEGEIHVYSEPGLGASFKIYFPAIQEKVEQEPSDALLEMPRGSEMILVVEDEDAVRKLIASILRKQGYTVVEARSGAEALAQHELLARPLDLMISDVVMPEMSGPQLAGQMLSVYPQLRVLYISGYTFNAVVQQDLVEPNVFFLQKPFTPEALTQKVREVVATDRKQP